jgi:hypothetical protein
MLQTQIITEYKNFIRKKEEYINKKNLEVRGMAKKATRKCGRTTPLPKMTDRQLDFAARWAKGQVKKINKLRPPKAPKD